MNKYLENSKKIEKHLLVVCMTLFVGLLVGGVGGYFVYATVNDTGSIPEAIKFIEVDETEDVEKVINKLSYIDMLNKNLDDTNKLTNQEVLEFVFREVKSDINVDLYAGITLEEVQKVVDKYMNYKVTGEDIYLQMDANMQDKQPIVKYDGEKFIYNDEYPAVELNNVDVYNKIDKVYKSNDTYKVEVYKAYGNFDVYYGNMKDVLNNENILEDLEDNSKLTKVTYEFLKKDNNYILVSYNME